jgi:hypothetical protein
MCQWMALTCSDSENSLVTQNVRANRTSHKTSDRSQRATTKLVPEERAACASDKSGA